MVNSVLRVCSRVYFHINCPLMTHKTYSLPPKNPHMSKLEFICTVIDGANSYISQPSELFIPLNVTKRKCSFSIVISAANSSEYGYQHSTVVSSCHNVVDI